MIKHLPNHSRPLPPIPKRDIAPPPKGSPSAQTEAVEDESKSILQYVECEPPQTPKDRPPTSHGSSFSRRKALLTESKVIYKDAEEEEETIPTALCSIAEIRYRESISRELKAAKRARMERRRRRFTRAICAMFCVNRMRKES